MQNIFLKILKTKKTVIPLADIQNDNAEILSLGNEIQENVRRIFQGSLAIRQISAGSDNACEQELVALSNAYYDVERFGIHFVASPKHADMLMITGPITRNMLKAVQNACEGTPDPKIVVAVGDDAINGGIFRGNYAVCDAGKIADAVEVAIAVPSTLVYAVLAFNTQFLFSLAPPEQFAVVQAILFVSSTRNALYVPVAGLAASLAHFASAPVIPPIVAPV
jgi:Ni,Fe-hydrogenase III small subunit